MLSLLDESPHTWDRDTGESLLLILDFGARLLSCYRYCEAGHVHLTSENN